MKLRIALIPLILVATLAAVAQTANTISPSDTIEPADLVKMLPKSPVILNVGPRTIYLQAHIPTAEYVGMTYEPAGIQALRERVKKLQKRTLIVLYCGCCPWERCPNLAPALNEMHSLGFKNVKALHISQNFGADWVNKGYPIQTGQPAASGQ